MKYLLKNRAFWALFGTQFFGAFNDNFFRSAFITLVTYHLTQYTPTEKSLFVSAAFGFLMLPFFLFSPLAGQLSDRFDKTLIVRLVKVSEVLIVSVSAYGFIHRDPHFLLGALFWGCIPPFLALPNTPFCLKFCRGKNYWRPMGIWKLGLFLPF